MNNLPPNMSDWVNCPICGDCDMRLVTDPDGEPLIFCTNHACASNGGTNSSALVSNEIALLEAEIERLKNERNARTRIIGRMIGRDYDSP